MKQETILKIEITKDEAGQYFAWVTSLATEKPMVFPLSDAAAGRVSTTALEALYREI